MISWFISCIAIVIVQRQVKGMTRGQELQVGLHGGSYLRVHWRAHPSDRSVHRESNGELGNEPGKK
jgi:hypothetical protein